MFVRRAADACMSTRAMRSPSPTLIVGIEPGRLGAGVHALEWSRDGRQFGGGVYFARAEVRSGDRTIVRTARIVSIR